jgi:hypothetical protein
MAFNFNDQKGKLTRAQFNSKIITQQLRQCMPFFRLDEKRRAANEHGCWGLLFYYYFLEQLFEVASNHRKSEVPQHLQALIDEPEDVVEGMRQLSLLYSDYHLDNDSRLERILRVMMTIRNQN